MERRATVLGALLAAPLATLVLAAGCGGSEQTAPTTAAGPGSSTTATTRSTTTAPTTTAAMTVATAPSSTTTVTTTATVQVPYPHVFPVQPAGAASYDPSHHDYLAADIFAPCGSDVVAVTSGVIDEVSHADEWSSGTDNGATRSGRLVSLVGDDGVRYYGSHLAEVAPGIDAGTRVSAGQRVGAVGDSGNARGTGCHLHFGLSAPCGPGDWERRRGEVWPQPHLDA